MLRLDCTYSQEYDLYGSLTAEVIGIYGCEVDYIKTSHLGVDKVLGDITNYGFETSFKVILMPENRDGGELDERGDLLSKFGFTSNEGVNFFISAETLRKIVGSDDFRQCYGDIIRLQSGKLLEVVNVEHQVPGINNHYTSSVHKNVYLLKCKQFNYNYDELPRMESTSTDKDDTKLELKTLDEIFGILGDDNDNSTSLDEMKKEQDKQSPIDNVSNKDKLGDLWN